MMKTILDFTNIDEKGEDPEKKTPIFISCKNCHAKFSEKALQKTNGLCPACHKNPYEKSNNPNNQDIVLESPEEIEVWESI